MKAYMIAKSVIAFLLVAMLVGCSGKESTNDSVSAISSPLHKESTYTEDFDNLEEFDYEVVCANSYVAQVHKIISDSNESIEYTLTQGKDGKTNVIQACKENSSSGYLVTVGDDAWGIIQTLLTDFPYWDAITFVDANLDGYADIQVYVGGTLNEMSDLYLWDSSANEFKKVLYEGFDMLSNYEINEGFLMNWVKKTAMSGVIERLEWDGNTLTKVSEEEYILGGDEKPDNVDPLHN